MIDLRPALRRHPSVPLVLMAALVLAGCAGTGAGSGSGSPASAPPPASTLPSSPPSDAPSDAPPAPGGSLDPAVPTACVTLGDADCARARDLAATVLAPGDPPVRYVQVGPFGCLAGDRCPTTLVARPEGDITLEFDGGLGINVHLKVAPDGSFEAVRGEAMGVPVEPSSAVGFVAGPQPFTLGHCGVFSGIDADGTWWDPVGPVPMDSGDAVNATTGVLTLVDPTHATFVAPSGFAIQLERRTGAKLLPFCM